ncbi:MAG: protein-tyrosine phosphatase family protein [Brevundimonas sp.]
MKIHWIGLEASGRLGVAARPEGGDGLDAEMAGLAYDRVDHLVSLLRPGEADVLGLAEEGAAALRRGVGFYNFPIIDHGVPTDMVAYRRVAHAIDRRLHAGQTIVIHCRAGLGRAPSLAVCALIEGGEHPDEAVLRVGKARGRPVPETDAQLAFIRAFAADPD